MKWKTYFIIILLIALPCSSRSKENKATDLAAVTVFSMGLNGFVATKLPEQLLYEEILKDTNSAEIFEEILNSPESTPEGKAYAACGLWDKNGKDKIKIDEKYQEMNVSILTADVLRKYKLNDVITRIRTHGCK